MSKRMYFTAGFARSIAREVARMDALLAEAAAWREVAWWIDSFGHGLSLPWTERFPLLRPAMVERLHSHHALMPVDFDQPTRVLAALFLALECEDDARKTKP